MHESARDATGLPLPVWEALRISVAERLQSVHAKGQSYWHLSFVFPGLLGSLGTFWTHFGCQGASAIMRRML